MHETISIARLGQCIQSLSGGLLCLCLVLAPCLDNAQSGSPRILFAKSTLDFGNVIEGQLLTDTIQIENVGAGTLEILQLQPT